MAHRQRGEPASALTAGSWKCGTEASNHLAGLVEGREIECEALDRDRYGRIIARCTADGTDVIAAMIDTGLAWAYVEYSRDYVEREAAAKASASDGGSASAVGLSRRQVEPRRSGVAATCCPIKGNINREGERIYHTPWLPHYDRTRIEESEGKG